MLNFVSVATVEQAAGYDVVTMDTETGRKATRDALEEAARGTGREPAVVQGNFDPRLLTDGSDISTVNVSAPCAHNVYVKRLYPSTGSRCS